MKVKFGIHYFLFFSSIAVMAPYLQVMLRTKGFSPSEIGLLLGFYEITGIFGPILAGWTADRLGRYRLPVLFLSFFSSFSLFLFGGSSSFLITAFTLILFGLFYRPIPSLQDALASRTLQDPLKNYGTVRIWGSIGFIAVSLGIQFSGFLDNSSLFRIITLFSCFMGLLFFSTLTLSEVKPETSVLHHQAADRKLCFSICGSHPFSGIPLPFWIALVTAFFIKMGLSSYYSFFSLFLNDVYSLNNISGIWAIGALAEIPMLLWGSRLVIRFGPASMFVLSAAGSAVRLFLYASGLPLPFILFAQLFHAFSFGLIHITVVSIINHSVATNKRALAMSIYGGIGFGLAGFIGSSVSGYVLGGYGFTALYIFSGSITLIPLVFVFLFRKFLEVGAFRQSI